MKAFDTRKISIILFILIISLTATAFGHDKWFADFSFDV